MDIVLRDIRDGERDRVFDIVKRVLREHGLRADPETTDKDLSDIKSSYIDTGGCFKVVEDGGEIVGSYGLFPLSETTCELRKMYLLPGYQGKGIGRLMMDDALTEARRRRFGQIVLETNSVLGKAGRLYERYGFKEYRPDHLSERCDFAMRLIL